MIAASGTRIRWHQLPAHVRSTVEDIVGGRVVAAESQPGGFSPGTADRIVTADRHRAFVKAVSPQQNPRSVELLRQETRITEALPETPLTPRVLGSFDDGTWAALILEDIEGRQPRTPWVEAELAATVTALRDLAGALTPPPAVAGLPTAARMLDEDLSGWSQVAADPPADLDGWAAAHLDDLRAAAERAKAAVTATGTLVHGDVRADNLLIRPDGGVVVVYWPWACAGPDWLDRALLGVEVVAHSGDPGPLFEGIDPAVTVDLLAGYAGFFTDLARRPDPPGLPTVRAFQKAQADALRPWLRQHLPRG